MYPALSQVCCLQAPFESDIHGFADAAGNAIELWLTKLEEYLKTHTVADVRKLAEDREQKFVAASFQGGLLFSQGDARREAWGNSNGGWTCWRNCPFRCWWWRRTSSALVVMALWDTAARDREEFRQPTSNERRSR